MHGLLNKVADLAAHSSYEVMKSLGQQIAAVPRATKTLVTVPAFRTLVNQSKHIILHDAIPIAIACYVNDVLQRFSDDQVNDNAELLSVDTFLKLSISLIGVGVTVYKYRSWTQQLVHTQITTAQSIKLFNEFYKNVQICQEQTCSILRFTKGTFRHISNLAATEALLFGINLLPFVGPYLSPALAIYPRGQIFLIMALPSMCQRHASNYIQQYPELAFSLGLTHEVIMRSVGFALSLVASHSSALLSRLLDPLGIPTHYFEMTEGIPSYYYDTGLYALSMLAMIYLTANMKLPKAVETPTRNFYDPVIVTQQISGELFDYAVLKIKDLLTVMFNQPPSDIDWTEVYNKALQIAGHPLSLKIRKGLYRVNAKNILPPMFQSCEQLKTDVIIKPNWEMVCHMIIDGIDDFNNLKQNRLIVLASRNPEIPARVYNMFFGTSVALTKFALSLVTNKDVQEHLDNLRAILYNDIAKKHEIVEDKIVEDFLDPEITNTPPVLPTSENTTKLPLANVNRLFGRSAKNNPMKLLMPHSTEQQLSARDKLRYN